MPKISPLRVLKTVLFVLSLAGAAAEAAVPSAKSLKPASPVRLDGRVDDWAGVPRLTDGGSKAEFAFQNDGRNLYILVIVGKAESVQAAEATGMTVTGRPAGSKAAAKGILFLNGRINADGFIAWQESQGVSLTEKDKIVIRLAPSQPLGLTFAVDEKGGPTGPLQKRTAGGPPDFRTNASSWPVVYEILVPLDPADPGPGAFGVSPGGTLRLTFKWGGSGRKSLAPQAGPDGGAWAQRYLAIFDEMSRPAGATWKYSYSVDVTLADGN